MNGLFALALSLTAQLPPFGGTQPGELPQALIPQPSTSCNCHLDYDPSHRNEPGESYMVTAMALAARSPVFLAAFRVANQDRPEAAALCIRCHMPRGWLAARATPGDGSGLEPEDLQGITCDVCHRMVPADPPVLGDGQYTIANSSSKRGPRDYLPNAHTVSQDPYISSAEACGICHSLYDPLETHKGPDGEEFGIPFYEQRTFEEWKGSDYSQPGGKVCIDCHMKTVEGYSSGFDKTNLYPDMRVHSFVGGNLFLARSVAMLYPDLEIGPRLPQLERWVDEQLRTAATLEITYASPARVEPGAPLDLAVRVTNETGHKLPTGYPEGRRVYLEVSLVVDGRAPQILSGRWLAETGDLDLDDPQLKTYDTGHGILGQGRSPHVILANQTLWDTRIPPKGYRPMYPDMVPFGRDYGSGPPYRHWDDTKYSIPIPRDIAQTTGTKVVVRLMYLSFPGFYYDFLIDQLPSDSPEAQNLRTVYEALGKSPPQEMARAELALTMRPATEPPDAGWADVETEPPDLGVETEQRGEQGGGCDCSAHRTAGEPGALGLLLLSFALVRRRRSR